MRSQSVELGRPRAPAPLFASRCGCRGLFLRQQRGLAPTKRGGSHGSHQCSGPRDGGSGGLGACICAHLARADVDVAVGYRSGADRAEETAAAHRASGRRAVPVALDQADPASVEGAVAAVIAIAVAVTSRLRNSAGT
ncbi:MAG: SDR family NAD(P)-dependent oxidoreductase [Pseudomonadota bacterium]